MPPHEQVARTGRDVRAAEKLSADVELREGGPVAAGRGEARRKGESYVCVRAGGDECDE